jgi:transposase
MKRRLPSGRVPSCPRLKKAQEEERTLLFIDESAFYLLPGVVTTWAPAGETPVLRCKLTRDHLSAISAITPEGKLYLSMQDKAFDSDDVVAFLQLLLKEITGKLLIIWDGAPIHRSKTLRQFLADGAAARIYLARLPAYAPDLNPDEGIWHYLKHVKLKNCCCADLADLRQHLTTATAELIHQPQIIKACFAQVGYY